MPQRINPENGKGYRFKDRTGQRNGRLVFIRQIGLTKHKHHIWEAMCDCGTITTTTTPKKTKSCGCLQREAASRTQLAKALPKEDKRKNRLKAAAKQRARRRENPICVMQARLSRLHRHALARVEAIKSSPTFDALGYTPQQLVVHIERQFQRGMGWHNMDRWQIDHIIPSSQAQTEQDVIALNQLSNLRPMWAEENNVKRNRRESLL